MRWIVGVCFLVLAMPVIAVDVPTMEQFNALEGRVTALEGGVVVPPPVDSDGDGIPDADDPCPDDPLNECTGIPVDPQPGLDVVVTKLGVDSVANHTRAWADSIWVDSLQGILIFGGNSHIPTNNNSLRYFDPITGNTTQLTENTGSLWDEQNLIWSDTGVYNTRCNQRDNPTQIVMPDGRFLVITGASLMKYCAYDLTTTGDEGWRSIVIDDGVKTNREMLVEFLEKEKIDYSQYPIDYIPVNTSLQWCGGKFVLYGGSPGSSTPTGVFSTLEPNDDPVYTWKLVQHPDTPMGKRGWARNSSACVDDRYYYFHGGYQLKDDGVYSYRNDMWKLDTVTMEWTFVDGFSEFAYYPVMTFDPDERALVLTGGNPLDADGKIDWTPKVLGWLYYVDTGQAVDITGNLIQAGAWANGHAGSGLYVPKIKGHVYLGGIRFDASGKQLTPTDNYTFTSIFLNPSVIYGEDQNADLPADTAQGMVDETPEGGTLTIPPGDYDEYLLIRKSITLNMFGVNLLRYNAKGVIDMECDDCTVEINNWTVDGASIECAKFKYMSGIKMTGFNPNLILNDVRIDGCPVSVLTSNTGGTVTATNLSVDSSAAPWGYAHTVYIGLIDEATFTGLTITNPHNRGNLFKSRATKTTLINSTLLGENGEHARGIDFPCGGEMIVHNNVLSQSDQADNAEFLVIGLELGTEGCVRPIPKHELIFTDNEFTTYRDKSEDEPAANAYGPNLFAKLQNGMLETVTRNVITTPIDIHYALIYPDITQEPEWPENNTVNVQ